MRFGHTLELDLLGSEKICGFDCVYCSLGPSKIRVSRIKHDAKFNDAAAILQHFSEKLAGNLLNGSAIPFETILVSGNGEPTLHPDFPTILKAIIAKRDEFAPKAPGKSSPRIVVLTNGDRFDQRDVIDALNLADECIAKVDVGTERAFKNINRPLSRSTLEKIIRCARDIKNLSVQTTVTGGAISLTQQTHLDEWIEVIAMLAPANVYLQRAKSPCADPTTELVSDDQVDRIAHWLERRLKIKAQVEFDSAA